MTERKRIDQLISTPHYTTWQLIKAYWRSSQRKSAYLFTISIFIMTIVLVAVDVLFNYWYNFFYDSLQAYDLRSTVRLLGVFCILATVAIVFAVYRYYISQRFALRWRKWLTEQFIDEWLDKRGYYYLEAFDEKTDNPDQRIQEDIAGIVTNSIDLATGLVAAISTFIAFIYILWTLSGIMHVDLGPLGSWRVPGYLVWVGLLYSLIGTLFAFKIGRPLVNLNFEQQRREATFRYAAIDLRSHAEHVALYRGEHHQKNILQRLFGGVLDNWFQIILRQKKLLWYTAGYNQISVLLPLVVALPNYFEKVFLLGGLIQSLQAFNKVQDSLSFLINSYTQIAQWRAISARLTTFMNHLQDAEHVAEKENKLQITKQPTATISAKNVTVKTPRNELLLNNVNENFAAGKNYLIKGESGIGKSTFVRALAGIWPYASGEVAFPQNQRVMYLPQKAYMPIGTLAEAIMFPDKHHPELEKNIEQVLRECNLENFIPRLKEVASWSEQLSPGEQQRIGFARLLLHKPDWAFLDESTSMLDLTNEKHMYQLLKEKLPKCSIVSVGHRPSLDAHHDQIIDMSRYAPREVRE